MSGNRDSHFQQELIIQRASNMNGFVLLAVSCLLASTVGLTTLACSMPSSKRLNPTPMPPSHAPPSIYISTTPYGGTTRNSAGATGVYGE